MSKSADAADPAKAEPPPRASRRAIARACASALAGLLIGEVLLRAWLAWHFSGRLESLPGGIGGSDPLVADMTGMCRALDDTDLAFALIPGARGKFREGPITINSAGFRDREFPSSKAPGTKRLEILGDSHAFGWRARREDAFPAVLEGALQDLAGESRKVEVFNLSVPGYNMAQKVACFEANGRRLEPDGVILHYSLDDALPPGLRADRDFLRLDRLYIARVAEIASGAIFGGDAILRGIDYSRTRQKDGVGPLEMDERDVPERYRHLAGWEAMARALKRLRDQCRRMEIPLWVALPASNQRLDDPAADRDANYDRIRGLCEELGVAVIDTYPDTRAFAARYQLVNEDLAFRRPTDMHPNPARHALTVKTMLTPIAEAFGLAQPGDARLQRKLVELENLARERMADVFLFAPEEREGERVRWTGKQAKVFVRSRDGGFTLPYLVGHRNMEAGGPIEIEFTLEGRAPVVVSREKTGRYAQTFADCPNTSESLMLRIDVSRTFREGYPGRDLGIALCPIEPMGGATAPPATD